MACSRECSHVYRYTGMFPQNDPSLLSQPSTGSCVAEHHRWQSDGAFVVKVEWEVSGRRGGGEGGRPPGHPVGTGIVSVWTTPRSDKWFFWGFFSGFFSSSSFTLMRTWTYIFKEFGASRCMYIFNEAWVSAPSQDWQFRVVCARVASRNPKLPRHQNKTITQ